MGKGGGISFNFYLLDSIWISAKKKIFGHIKEREGKRKKQKQKEKEKEKPRERERECACKKKNRKRGSHSQKRSCRLRPNIDARKLIYTVRFASSFSFEFLCIFSDP